MKNCPRCSNVCRDEAMYCNQCGRRLRAKKVVRVIVAFLGVVVFLIFLAAMAPRDAKTPIPVETTEDRVTRELQAFKAMSSAEHLAAARIKKDSNNEDLFKARQHLAAIPKSAPEYRKVASLWAAADKREKELWTPDGAAAIETITPQTSTPDNHRSNTARSNERHFSPGGGEAAVATTVEALDDLTRAATRGDKYGYAEVFFSGRAFILQSGTRVLVLDVGFLKTQIRVLEGPQVNKSGWVPSEWVR